MERLASAVLLLVIGMAMFARHRTRRAHGRFGHWLGILIGTALVVETTGVVLATIGVANTWMYNSFAVFEFLVFLRLVWLVLPAYHMALLTTAAVGLGGFVYSYSMHPGHVYLLTEGIILVASISSGWSLFVLWQLAQRSGTPLWQQPLFWFFMGTLVYFGGIVPFVGMMPYLHRNNVALTRTLYVIITAVAIVRYLFTIRACVLARKHQDWKEHEH